MLAWKPAINEVPVPAPTDKPSGWPRWVVLACLFGLGWCRPVPAATLLVWPGSPSPTPISVGELQRTPSRPQ